MKLNADKSELLWVGTKYCLSVCDGRFPCLRLRADTVFASHNVCVLGVVISSDLSLEKHASNVSATGFHHLRQLRRIQRSVNRDSAATLVRAFVTSRVDYCNAVFVVAPKVMTNKLQRILNTAACVVTATRKFDRSLSQLLHTELRWLDILERVKYKLSVMMVHRCLSGCAPRYLATYCVSVSSVAAKQHLRSVHHQLAVPSHRLSTYGRRVFAISGPMTWNSLPTHLRRVEIMRYIN